MTATDDRTTETTTTRTPVTVLRDGTYATIGATDAAIGYVRRLGGLATSVDLPDLRRLGRLGRPGAIAESVRGIGAEVEEQFDAFAGRGRDVVASLRGSRPTRDAAERARVARSQVRAATTSIGRAGAAGGAAVEHAAETIGTDDAVDYESMTIAELRELARERDIEGRSEMNKAELVTALERS